jgi:hypothetical protein
LLALLLIDVGKEQRQQEGSCQENGRRHIDVDQQVTAPTPDATCVENSRDLQGIRVRIRPSFVEVNVCRAYSKRQKSAGYVVFKKS